MPFPKHSRHNARVRLSLAVPLRRYYLPIATFMAVVLPTLICGLGWGGYTQHYPSGWAAAIDVLLSTIRCGRCLHIAYRHLSPAAYSNLFRAGDYWGGYFIAGVARLVFVHHSTFCVNSLAHWAGSATYTDGHTARNSIITALVTLGEGYHNFHHEFPSDYRLVKCSPLLPVLRSSARVVALTRSSASFWCCTRCI